MLKISGYFLITVWYRYIWKRYVDNVTATVISSCISLTICSVISFHLKMFVIAYVVLILKISFRCPCLQLLSFYLMDCHIILYFISTTIGIWTKTTCPSIAAPSLYYSVFILHRFDWFTLESVFCPTPVDNIWAAITFCEISGKIVGNVFCCIFVISKWTTACCLFRLRFRSLCVRVCVCVLCMAFLN